MSDEKASPFGAGFVLMMLFMITGTAIMWRHTQVWYEIEKKSHITAKRLEPYGYFDDEKPEMPAVVAADEDQP